MYWYSVPGLTLQRKRKCGMVFVNQSIFCVSILLLKFIAFNYDCYSRYLWACRYWRPLIEDNLLMISGVFYTLHSPFITFTSSHFGSKMFAKDPLLYIELYYFWPTRVYWNKSYLLACAKWHYFRFDSTICVSWLAQVNSCKIAWRWKSTFTFIYIYAHHSLLLNSLI